MGPLELADLIGLDTCLNIMEVLHRDLGTAAIGPVHSFENTLPRVGWDARRAAASTRMRTDPPSPSWVRKPVEIFEAMADKEHDQLVFWSDVASGYRGISAIHDTTLGPALGGTRFWNYPSEAEAITDVLRLARGMTYKAAITGLALGGGKSVIIGDNHTREREAIFRAMGGPSNLSEAGISPPRISGRPSTTWSTFARKPSG